MRRAPNQGFTLVELMVTVAIVAIVVAIAFPSFEGSFRSNRVATSTNELVGSFALARSEALRNPGGAILCTSTDGLACGGDWNDGWIVGVDLNSNGGIDAADRIVRYVVTNDRIALTATAVAGSATMVRFDRRGRVVDGNARTVTLVPAGCPAGLELMREFQLRATGQVWVNRRNCT